MPADERISISLSVLSDPPPAYQKEPPADDRPPSYLLDDNTDAATLTTLTSASGRTSTSSYLSSERHNTHHSEYQQEAEATPRATSSSGIAGQGPSSSSSFGHVLPFAPPNDPIPMWLRRNLMLTTITIYLVWITAIVDLAFARFMSDDLKDEYVSQNIKEEDQKKNPSARHPHPPNRFSANDFNLFGTDIILLRYSVFDSACASNYIYNAREPWDSTLPSTTGEGRYHADCRRLYLLAQLITAASALVLFRAFIEFVPIYRPK